MSDRLLTEELRGEPFSLLRDDSFRLYVLLLTVVGDAGRCSVAEVAMATGWMPARLDCALAGLRAGRLLAVRGGLTSRRIEMLVWPRGCRMTVAPPEGSVRPGGPPELQDAPGEPPGLNGHAYSPRFLAFWDAWPKGPNKTDKTLAWREWRSAARREGGEVKLEAAIAKTMRAWAESRQWADEGGKYRKKPAWFLRDGTYHSLPGGGSPDEVVTTTGAAGAPQNTLADRLARR